MLLPGVRCPVVIAALCGCRIMATSAHNAGISGLSQSATEVLSLVAGGKEGRCMRSASASPAQYQQQLSALPSPMLPER